jgi:cytoskeletal protein CcmA (bactofilin family)
MIGSRPVVAVLALAGALVPAAAPGQERGAAVVVRGTRTSNTYAAGGTVEVLAEIDKDLVATGGALGIRGPVRGDVIAAGGTVSIDGPVGDDVRVAGGTVALESRVDGDLVAVGGNVTVTPGAHVGGRAWLAGGRVEVLGRLGGGVRAAGATVRFGGEADGDVQLAGGEIHILSGARVGGDLVYTSPRPARIEPGARIAGAVTHHRSDVAERAGQVWRVVRAVVGIALLVGVMVAGAVLLALFPTATVSAARTIGTAPGRSLGLGIAVVVGLPIVGALLVATVVGAPLGLAVLAGWGLVLLAGYLVAAVFLGEVGARLTRRPADLSLGARVLSLALALLLLALVSLIPVAGGLIVGAALLLGAGALALRLYRGWAGRVDYGP